MTACRLGAIRAAADAELRRRHPVHRYPPLRSAEPPPATQARRDELALTAGEQIMDNAALLEGLHSARRRDYRVIYRIDDERRLVTVVAIEHRSDIYRPRGL